jgi:Holliday junction DNA helicase RuvA
MIVRIVGKLTEVGSDAVVIDRDGLAYEIHVPACILQQLTDRIGENVTFHTIEYYEGTAVGGNLTPRLVGFLDPADRTFFTEFTKVKGIGVRKALRALVQPAAWIAEAIESGDARRLASLPELGKRTAEQVIATLKGKLTDFVVAATLATGLAGKSATAPASDLTAAQREALEILLQLGERRNEAIEKIRRATDGVELDDAGKIVEAIYRLK